MSDVDMLQLAGTRGRCLNCIETILDAEPERAPQLCLELARRLVLRMNIADLDKLHFELAHSTKAGVAHSPALAQ